MIDVNYFLTLLLITLRISAYFLASSVFFPSGTPARLKGSLALLLALGIISTVDSSTINSINNNYLLMFYAINEIMTGLILGFISNLIFQSVRIAGAWMDIHAGFSMVSVLDPTSKSSITLLGNFSYFVTMAFFFIIDGHHIFIKALVESINIIPIGKTIVYQETIMAVMKTIFSYFELGIKMAIPLVIIILLTDVCLGLISRTVPTIPVMIFGVPIKNMLGLITYLVLLPVILKLVSSAIQDLPNVFKGISNLVPAVPLALIFAEDDKTEHGTAKKYSQARGKGQTVKSKEIRVAITMLVCTLLIYLLWGTLVNGFKEVIIYFFNFPMLKSFDEQTLLNITITVALKVAKLFFPFALPLMVAGICASLMQSGFMFITEPLKPSLGKLNPLTGIKGMISVRSLVDLAKNIVVVTIISYLAYKYIVKNYQPILGISNLYLPTLQNEIRDLMVGIFKQITIALIIIAAIDYFAQYKMFHKSMKMSKQEVKDEAKQSEGDPKIKGKLKQKQREIGMRRMMKSVADATVVITNPTHLAIALKYEEGGNMEAPKVVGKGADYIAIKIKRIAKDNDVPIVENKQLARLIYEKVEIDEDIPQDMYQGVAEILAIVMKLKK